MPLIWLLIAVFILKQLLWVYLIPPWEAPDELAHFSYVQTLFYEQKLPELGKTLFSTQAEAIGPVPSGGNTSGQNLDASGEALTYPPQAIYQPGTKLNWIAQHPPLYYLLLVPFYGMMPKDDPALAIFLLRFISILLGAVTLYFSHKTLAKILPKGNMGARLAELFNITVVSALAFLPTFSYSSAIINNDNLVIALSAILIFLLISRRENISALNQSDPKKLSEKNKYSPRAPLLIGLVLGLMAITKTTSLPLILVTLIIYLADIFFAKNSTERRKFVFDVLKVFGIALLISGWWYARNYFIFKTFLPEIKDAVALNPALLSQHPYLTTLFPEVVSSRPQFGFLNFLFTKNFLIEYYKNIWGVFGRFFIQLNFWQYVAIFTFTALAIIGGLVSVVSSIRNLNFGRKSDHKLKNILAHSSHSGDFLFGLVFVVMASAISIKIWQISTARGFLAAMHGRYFLPAALPLLYFLIKGNLKMIAVKYHQIFLLSLILLFVFNDFTTVFYTIIPKL